MTFINTAITALLSILLTATLPDLAAALDQRLIGAWATSASDCKEIFEASAGKLTFRRPINKFTSAFIVDPRNVSGVNQTCSIGQVSSKGGYLNIRLECRDAISFIPMDARVKILSDTEISWGDAASDPTIDAKYERCVR
jgi:hypothetical protein